MDQREQRKRFAVMMWGSALAQLAGLVCLVALAGQINGVAGVQPWLFVACGFIVVAMCVSIVMAGMHTERMQGRARGVEGGG